MSLLRCEIFLEARCPYVLQTHCTHRHCVFTIDEELWHFFLEDRSLLDCLFQAARNVVLRMFHNLNKKKTCRGTQKKYIQNPPEGMTARLVRNMTDSDLLDMHYFLTEDNDLDDDEFEEGFYINLF